MSRQAEDEAREALGSMIWLSNNRHNYGSQEWLDLFDAAVEDARAALTAKRLPQQSRPKEG